VSQHSLSINGKHKEVNKNDLMTIAKANNIKKGEIIIKEIKETVCNWPEYAAKVNVPSSLTDTITNTLVALKF
jgi:serine/threonine-protein kinase HipA